MAHADVNSPAPVSSSKVGRSVIGKTCAGAPWSGIRAIAESSRRSGLRASHAAGITSCRAWSAFSVVK